MRKYSRRLAVIAGAAIAALALWAAPASAHVEPLAETAAAGDTLTTALQVPHGCNGSPTTKLAIQVPTDVEDFKPQPVAGWTLSSTMRKVDPPQTIEGETITETLDTVTWTASPGNALPDDQMQDFWFTAQMPDEKAGTVITFPTVQTCEQGETQWIQPSKEGQAEPEHPVPAITLTKAESDDSATTSAEPTTSSTPSDSTTKTLAIIAIVVGAAGVVVGGIALARSSRRPSPPTS
jgi:periplasmic copper chaperone A